MTDVANSLDKAYNDNKEKIEKEVFELALKGLENGRMDYASDPILPYLSESINRSVKEFDGLTKEQ